MGDRKDNMAKRIKTEGEINPLPNITEGIGEVHSNNTRNVGEIETYMIWKAFSSVADKDEIKAMIPERNMEGIIDKTIRIRFGFTKGEDHETLSVQQAKPWRLLAVALNKLNGVTIESIVNEAERLDDDAEKLAKKDAELALAKIKSKTSKVIKGSVRVAGVSIEEVLG